MNEMELLREVAHETPLPAPGELATARARLIAAIAADPSAGRVQAVAGATVSQPFPSSGQLVLRPAAPVPVLDAVKLMCGGAVGTAVQLIIALFYLGDIRAYHLTLLGHRFTAAQLIHWRPLIAALAIVVGLVEIGLWLWTARAAGRGKSRARIMSLVLVGLATLQLGGIHGAADLFFAVSTWLTGLAAVWQLWRPASTAFFKSRAVSSNHATPGSDADRRR